MTNGGGLRALVFDMDGTLIESSTVIPDAYISLVEDLGGRTFARDEIVALYSVGPTKALLTHLLERPASDDEVDAYHRRLGELAGGVTVYDGIEETLEALRQQSVPLAVYTGASLRSCRILLGAAGLLDHFDALVGADEVARSKPEPDGIHLACERLGVAPASAAYVGDATNDLEAARRSGARAVAAAWGHLYKPGEPADVVLEDPRDLVGLVSG